MNNDNKLIFENYLKEDMYSDRVIHVDKSSDRAEMVFKPDDLDPELQEGGYYGPPIITGIGVSVYMGETDMWIIPTNETPGVSP